MNSNEKEIFRAWLLNQRPTDVLMRVGRHSNLTHNTLKIDCRMLLDLLDEPQKTLQEHIDSFDPID